MILIRLERSTITRTTTGKLPIQKSSSEAWSASSAMRNTPSAAIMKNAATSEEIKEKMERELKLQRAAHHQKRTLEMQKNSGGKYLSERISTNFL